MRSLLSPSLTRPLSVGALAGSLAGRPALYLVIYIEGWAARFQEAHECRTYMFLYTRGTWSSVDPAWILRGSAVLRTASKLQNIYVFIYKGHLEQRGSCVDLAWISGVEDSLEVAKHICFYIQKAPGAAWILRGSCVDPTWILRRCLHVHCEG